MDASIVKLLVALWPWIIAIKSDGQWKEENYSIFSKVGLKFQPSEFMVLQRIMHI